MFQWHLRSTVTVMWGRERKEKLSNLLMKMVSFFQLVGWQKENLEGALVVKGAKCFRFKSNLWSFLSNKISQVAQHPLKVWVSFSHYGGNGNFCFHFHWLSRIVLTIIIRMLCFPVKAFTHKWSAWEFSQASVCCSLLPLADKILWKSHRKQFRNKTNFNHRCAVDAIRGKAHLENSLFKELDARRANE